MLSRRTYIVNHFPPNSGHIIWPIPSEVHFWTTRYITIFRKNENKKKVRGRRLYSEMNGKKNKQILGGYDTAYFQLDDYLQSFNFERFFLQNTHTASTCTNTILFAPKLEFRIVNIIYICDFFVYKNNYYVYYRSCI